MRLTQQPTAPCAASQCHSDEKCTQLITTHIVLIAAFHVELSGKLPETFLWNKSTLCPRLF